MSFHDLHNLCILVTRPKPQGDLLCEKIAALGGQPVHLPTIQINPIQLHKQIVQMDQWDWLIFISPHTVLQGLPLIREYWPIFPDKIKLAAIGEGTANALRAAGFAEVVYSADEWSSEGLLKLACFQAISGKKIALVRGEGGREILTDVLTMRGANVISLIVYQRTLPDYKNIEQYLNLFRLQKIDIIVCASGESLHNLMKLIGSANQSLLLGVAIVVVSSRLVELAKEAGFKKVFLAANASHNAIIATLCHIRGKGHVRE